MFRLLKHATSILLLSTLCLLATTLNAATGVYDEYDAYAGLPCYSEENFESLWRVDYRVRRFFNSNTTYQFGVPGGWAPLSKLDWSLDSTWHGLRAESVQDDVLLHFEWLFPAGNQIDGNMIDSDWMSPYSSTPDLQTSSSQRWNDGQMLDIGARYMLNTGETKIWPIAGFRFQRFDMFASGVDYLIPSLGPDPTYHDVDVIKFNQQYYQFYLGGQIREEVLFFYWPVTVMFQADWAATWGYNVDHHMVRAGGDRYTMEQTQGNAFHLACGVEAPLPGWFHLGLQFDYMQIHATGSHRMKWDSQGLDEKWHNGVITDSNQASLTAYLRASF